MLFYVNFLFCGLKFFPKAVAMYLVLFGVSLGVPSLLAETPGEFRPNPVLTPDEQVGATGDKVQPQDTLPKSQMTGDDPAPLNKKPIARLQVKPTANEMVLNTGWKLTGATSINATGAMLSQIGIPTSGWYDATVPGTVLGSLVDQGVYPDPYFGLNNLQIPESLNKQDYWYRTEFTLPKTWAGRKLWLDFKGINYYAEIWLNGKYLGHITGAFIRGEFDVSTAINRFGTNALAVMIAPPPDPGIPSEQSVKFGPGDNGGKMCLDGPTFFCAEGWDWIPAIRDRCSGLWQDVVLRSTGPVTINDPQVVTKLPLPETSPANVTINSELRNSSSNVQQGVLIGKFEGVQVQQAVELQPGETKTVSFSPRDYPHLTVRHPRLWWPNGYGKPELYDLQLTFLTKDKNVSDQQITRFGIREMSYELGTKMPDGKVERVEFTPTLAPKDHGPVIDSSRKAMGWDPHQYETFVVAIKPGMENSPSLKRVNDEQMKEYLVVKVNGQKIECLGGNWGMDDALKQIPRERLEPYIRLHRDANLNMIRNWCGQSTSETFYDLCDEYGILVWNDFWMSTEGWNYAPANHELFLCNVADTIKRFRNHPCIALWCAQNEGVPPESINGGNDRLIRELDGTRYYQPNSRFVNLSTSGPWSNEPLGKYFSEINHGFSTELGAASVPSAEVMRTIMPEADLWPPKDVWSYHDFHTKGAEQRENMLGLVARRYGAATSLDDFCRKAQMVNYETYRAMFEGFNSRLWNDCSGVLVWMSHPSWPSVVWQLYSSDYDPNGAYFGAKKAAEPVHIQMNPDNFELAVINRHAYPLPKVTARARIFDLSGRELLSQKQTVDAAANDVTSIGQLVWPTNGAFLVKLELTDQAGRLLSENFYWQAIHDEQLQALDRMMAVALCGNLRVLEGTAKHTAEVDLSNPSSVPALAIRLVLRDARTGRRVLPAYYEDNYFSLLPGESRRIRIEGLPLLAKPAVELTGWNIQQSNLEEGIGITARVSTN